VSCFPPCSIKSTHIPHSCSQKLLPITRVVHQSLAEVPRCCFSTYKVVFHRHQCHHCAKEATVDYLSSPLRSCFGIVSLLISHPYTRYQTPPSLSASYPLVSVFPTPQYLWYQASVSLPSSQTRITTLPLSSLLSIFAILPTTQPPYQKHTNIPCRTELFTAIQQFK
jgi:hypothetical protein